MKRAGVVFMVLFLGSAAASHGQEAGDSPVATVNGEEVGVPADTGGEVILHSTERPQE